MTDRLRRNSGYLEVLAHGTPKQRKAILEGANDDLCRCLSEICLNALRGNVPLTEINTRKLRKHKGKIRKLGDHQLGFSHKKKIIRQKGGFLQLLAGPVIGIITDLVAGGIKKAVAKGKQRRALARLKKSRSAKLKK